MYIVKVYLKSNAIVEFKGRDTRNAREIAKRIVTEGLWTEADENGTEEFYPVGQIYKVKIIKQ